MLLWRSSRARMRIQRKTARRPPPRSGGPARRPRRRSCRCRRNRSITRSPGRLGEHDAPQQRLGLLRGVAHALAVALLEVIDVGPHIRRIDGRVLVIGIQLPAGADGEAHAPALIHKALHVVAPFGAARRADGVDVEIDARAPAVEEDGVVLAREAARGAPAGLIAPDDLVHEVGAAEDLVQQQAHPGRSCGSRCAGTGCRPARAGGGSRRAQRASRRGRPPRPAGRRTRAARAAFCPLPRHRWNVSPAPDGGSR